MEAATVLRFCRALLACLLALPLVAAAPPITILATPTLLVYPFAVNGSDVSKEAGSRLAVTIATQIASLGGVNVKPAPPGVERTDYLNAALRERADYYIAGYVTPLGDGVSVVEQLVSTLNGIVVYSNTAQVRGYADATDQGDVLREALLRHQTRNLGAYSAPPPSTATAAPTPAPGNATQANLGRLFGRRQKRAGSAPSASSTPPAARPALAAATPTPAAEVAVAALRSPQRGAPYALLGIGGSAASDRRTFTGAAIRNVMLANHRQVTATASSLGRACRDANVEALLGGNLSTGNQTILGQRETSATLEFLAYDCSGSVVYRKTFARDVRGDWQIAVDRVVESAVAEFLREPARRS